jgi:[ribosomal protein S18]-alanine N-acetyltransferase
VPEHTRAKESKTKLNFQLLSQTRAHEIVTWRYENPYDFYNIHSDHAERVVKDLLEPNNHCFEILDATNVFLGHCSFGPDAQVSGGDYSESALDIGMGIDPARTGQGAGASIAKTVLEFAQIRFSPARFRVTIATFNHRAIRVWQGLGFEPVGTFTHAKLEAEFVILKSKVS